MPQQQTVAVENNFTKGLVTEFTALNFPENAATDCDNVEFTVIGDVVRRLGIDYEIERQIFSVDRVGTAVNTYKWDNAGGDGSTQIMVVQVNGSLKFWKVSASDTSFPLSRQDLVTDVDLSDFVADGGTFDTSKEAQFTDGNGYLFVFHPSCDPIYCTYASDVITGNRITVNVRDFLGVIEADSISSRPLNLSNPHQYNLSNQGWTQGSPWQGVSSTSVLIGIGSKTFTVASGMTVTLGNLVYILNAHPASPGGIFQPAGETVMSGNVTAYAGTTLTVNVTAVAPIWSGSVYNDWLINPVGVGYISKWHTDIGNYPSNADVWWRYKNTSEVFDPATTVGNVTLSTGPAPKGHTILNAFNQKRNLASNLSGLTDIITTTRPTNGAWFQGRVWYTGLNASQSSSGTAGFYTWTESIYFSQIIIDNTNFGDCYQLNDPTSENLFDLLPTDGGVITIQGCGPIYRLFPIQNGMIVFAANGVWFITGNQGIGFSATDYTITKLSAVKSISTTSYVDVLGIPYFWNADGIYVVSPSDKGGLSVQSITYNTIDSIYEEIPLSSKLYARGAYDPVNYKIQWLYRSIETNDVTERYTFDKILNFNTSNKAFFPYSVQADSVSLNGISYVNYPGTLSNTPQATFKYLTTNTVSSSLTFSDEHDDDYVDWSAANSTSDYTSYFLTGYKIRGQAIKRFQPLYIQVYCKTNDTASAYKIQGIWDYANSGSSGRWSTQQLVTNALSRFDAVSRRHKIRGHGYVVQFKFTSVTGMPFDIQGWSVQDSINAGV